MSEGWLDTAGVVGMTMDSGRRKLCSTMWMSAKERESVSAREIMVQWKRILPGTVNVLKNASTNNTSHIVRDELSYRYDRRYAAINSVIFETGRLVLRRMASGTGIVGVMAKIEGMPNIKVPTDKNAVALTRDFGGSDAFCSTN